MYKHLFSRKGSKEERERLSIGNGNRLLKELIKLSDGKYNPFRVFSEQEIQQATENFHERLIIRVDHFYDMYKGSHRDRMVMVKKYHRDTDHEMIWSLNEIVIASMVNHENILRILGCCLETKTPMLVYEYPSKGMVKNYIFNDSINFDLGLSWENKLRMAYQMAYALTYLHTFNSMPILHRSVRITNMYLDNRDVLKLCGFEFSMPIPPGANHVEVYYKNTIGFVAPEAIKTNKFTVKNDVFGFGAILMEIVTGKSLVKWGITQLSDITEEKVLELVSGQSDLERINKEQLIAAIRLAHRCLKTNPEERPFMKEVAEELRHIKNM